jgi:hypothetical protein
MKKFYTATLLLSLPLLMAAGIPNFFAGLIGDNVQDYCRMAPEEQVVMLQSVNSHTGNHRVDIVCGEVTMEVKNTPRPIHRRRMAR